MTIRSQTHPRPRPMILPFPIPGNHVLVAYRELNLAYNGTDEEKQQIGNPAFLPRPWEPATCIEPELRLELWQWLDDVVIWLNQQLTWDVAAMIPTCWPEHPHLIHEIAVVADQRRRASMAASSDALEEWQRYCLPAFIDRMRQRLRSHCDDEHVNWPGRSRHNQHISESDRHRREDAFVADVDALPQRARAATTPATKPTPTPAPARPAGSSGRRPAAPVSATKKKRLTVVDSDTGEIQDEYEQ